MKYLSVCSGIEAATVAWHSLGWTPLAFSEIEPFARAVLTHHYPEVPLHGDFTLLRDQPWIEEADILVGGTPCQAFSVAGLRNSLSDERGNLSLEFVRLADAIDDLRLAGGGQATRHHRLGERPRGPLRPGQRLRVRPRGAGGRRGPLRSASGEMDKRGCG